MIPCLRSSFAVVVFTSFISSPFLVFADSPEPGKAGRLTDGRAYRIDAEGNQLIDHIAELEVTIDGLERQVRVLEDELDERARGIVPPSAARTTDSGLVEQNLISPRHLPSAPKATAALPPAATFEQAREESCDQFKTEIASLKSRLDASTKQVAGRQAEQAGEARALETALAGKSEELAAIQIQFQQTVAQNQKLKQQLSALAVSQEHSARARLDALPAPLTTSTVSQDIVQARAEFKKNLHNIQALIASRKNLIDKLTATKRGISVNPQPLVSKSGHSLDRIRLVVEKLDSEQDIAIVRSGLREIELVLRSDIELMKRLASM